MKTEMPLWQKLYTQAEFIAVARAVGYRGITVREMGLLIEELAKEFGKTKVESAFYHLTVFDGQMTCNPKPLAKVELRQHVRKVCHQLLGPPPESPMYERMYGKEGRPEAKAPIEPPTELPKEEPKPETKDPPPNGKPKAKKPPKKEKN